MQLADKDRPHAEWEQETAHMRQRVAELEERLELNDLVGNRCFVCPSGRMVALRMHCAHPHKPPPNTSRDRSETHRWSSTSPTSIMGWWSSPAHSPRLEAPAPPNGSRHGRVFAFRTENYCRVGL